MMNSLRSDSIIFRGNVVFSSLSTSTNSFKRLKPDTGGDFSIHKLQTIPSLSLGTGREL
jgi:hypothetical protein